MSHALHADNCQIKPDQQCDYSPPSYHYRDYSALLYLNKEFSGGSLVFADKDHLHQITVRMTTQPAIATLYYSQDRVVPSCGKMAAFTAGPENIHGVEQIISGERCVLAAWFSSDKTFEVKHFFDFFFILLAVLIRSLKQVWPGNCQNLLKQVKHHLILSEKLLNLLQCSMKNRLKQLQQ